jgi:predicted alpha/beta-fold hydrolase
MADEDPEDRGRRRLEHVVVPTFEPPPLLGGAFVQTALIPFVPAPRGPRGEQVEVAIDGGTLVGRLDRAVASARRDGAAALVLHGITGTSDEPFVLRTADKLTRKGVDVLRLSLRGVGESRGRAPGVYHAGMTEDVRSALGWLCSRYKRVGVVGFSLGGQLALRALGEWGPDTPRALKVAVAVSAPLDLARSSAHSERLRAALFRGWIVARLHLRYLQLRGHLPPEVARAPMLTFTTIRGWDEAVVAPTYGFQDADEYYARCGSGEVLHRITVPTALLHADDDPVVPVGPTRDAAARAPSHFRFVFTDRGGHMGFLAAFPAPGDTDRCWAENRAAEFVAARV